MSRLPIPAGLALLAAGGLLIVLVAASCGGTEEQATSSSPTAQPAATATSTTPTPDVATPTTKPTSVASVPADWATFYKPDQFGDATLRYPPTWYGESSGGIYSANPAEWPSVCRPKGGMGIQASALPTQDSPRPKGAIDFKLGSYAGWEIVEQNTGDCPGRAHTVTILRAGLSYVIIFISDSEAEEPVFEQIVASFKLPAGT